MADGGITYPLGQVEVNLDFNGPLCSKVMTGVDITSPIFLVMDFLVKQGTILDMVRSCLVLDSRTFTCKTEELDQMFIVVLTKAVEVPHRCEIIIEGEILHPPHFMTGLLENIEEIVDMKRLFAACILEETCSKKMLVMVINLYGRPQMLLQGQVAAICQAAKLTSVQEAVAGEAQPQVLPIHLQGIGHKCWENLSRREYSKVVNLLLKYQDVFAKTKEDLGHTDLEQYRFKYRGCQTHKTTPRRMALEKSSSDQGNWKNGEGWCHKKIYKAMGITRSSSQKRQEIWFSVWTTDCWSIHATKTPIHYPESMTVWTLLEDPPLISPVGISRWKSIQMTGKREPLPWCRVCINSSSCCLPLPMPQPHLKSSWNEF